MRSHAGTAHALMLAKKSDDAKSPEIVRVFASLDINAEDGVERGADGAPIAFRMWKAGVNRTDHGDHTLTENSVRLLLESQAERGNRFAFDVDHLSLSEKAPPEARKAVGWFDIEERNGDLWATNIEWTAAVRGGFGGAAGDVPEWKYFSPAYETKKKSGEITRLLNCALTINPATHNVTELATMANEGKAAMADDKKAEDDDKAESLGQMLAAFEAEGDEEKRAAMKDAIRAKFKAAFPDDGEDGKEAPKKDGDKKEEKKASEEPKKEAKKASEEPKKETTKASESDDEKKAETIAASAATKFEQKLAAREEKIETDRILASLSPGDRETYKGLGLESLKRVVARHHSDVLTNLAAAGSTQPTRGSTQHNGRGSMLPKSEREELDEVMGIRAARPFVEEKDTLLVFNPHATAEDATQVLASITKEKQGNPSMRDGEAFTRVLANMKAGS